LPTSRENQKHRTRSALIDAAAVLARVGKNFSVAEVAEAAMVSTATAYRYFQNPQSLWFEVAIREPATNVSALIEGAGGDPAVRVDTMVSLAADTLLGDEMLWRAVLKATLERWSGQGTDTETERVPIRSDRRITLTRQALAPFEGELPPALLRRLTMGVMLLCGLEAMVATRDACHLDPDEAKAVMRWSAQALIRSALAEATDQHPPRTPA
jgi:AcrR family transcriptional regulator